MPQTLDQQIETLSAELIKLKRLKMADLQNQLAAIESGASGAGTGRRERRASLSQEEVTELLTKAVDEAGEEGISALAAANAAGLPYLRALQVMGKLFSKKGQGRNTRYFSKKKKK